MRTAKERSDAYDVIDEASRGEETNMELAERARAAGELLAEPFNPTDLMELIIDAFGHPDVGGSPETSLANTIEERIRGKDDSVIHDVRKNAHRLIVNGSEGEWYSLNCPASHAFYCVMDDRSDEPKLWRAFEADLATFIQQD